MKNQLIKTIIAACLIFPLTVIASPNPKFVSESCEGVFKSLEALYEKNKHEDPCSGRVLYSSYVMQGASGLAEHERFDEVLKNLRIAFGNLEKASQEPKSCPNLSKAVVRPMNEIEQIKSYINNN